MDRRYSIPARLTSERDQKTRNQHVTRASLFWASSRLPSHAGLHPRRLRDLLGRSLLLRVRNDTFTRTYDNIAYTALNYITCTNTLTVVPGVTPTASLSRSPPT